MEDQTPKIFNYLCLCTLDVFHISAYHTQKEGRIYYKNYIFVVFTCLGTFLEWSAIYRNLRIFWKRFRDITFLNHRDAWLGIVEFQYSSIDDFHTSPMLKTMAKNDLSKIFQ